MQGSKAPTGTPVEGCWFCLSNPNADVNLVASIGALRCSSWQPLWPATHGLSCQRPGLLQSISDLGPHWPCCLCALQYKCTEVMLSCGNALP